MNENNNVEKQIVWLSVDLLYPHPDNPRRDVGDVSELADSIKAKGVLQNLTVVPYKSKTHPDKVFAGYTVIIGHRRLAAAKKAGIDKLPCVIADMTEHEQVETMLLENMQRSDLTAFEEAKGIQMMFDFGETVETISEKTGFSKSTIRRRAKMLELGDKALEKIAKKKQVTFEEIDKLSDIKDADEREKCINALGTKNFKNEYEKALKHQEERACEAEWYKYFTDHGISEITEEQSSEPKYKYLGGHSMYSKTPEVALSEFEADKTYFYIRRYGYWLYFYTLMNKEDEEKALKEAEEREKAKQQANAAHEKAKKAEKRYMKLREEFISGLSEEFIIKNLDLIYKHLKGFKSFYFNSDVRVNAKKPAKAILEFVYKASFTNYSSVVTYNGGYAKDISMLSAYKFLLNLGYEPSDEEEAFMNGTSDLFVKGNK